VVPTQQEKSTSDFAENLHYHLHTVASDRLICRVKASAKVAIELKWLGIRHKLLVSGFIVQSLFFG